MMKSDVLAIMVVLISFDILEVIRLILGDMKCQSWVGTCWRKFIIVGTFLHNIWTKDMGFHCAECEEQRRMRICFMSQAGSSTQ